MRHPYYKIDNYRKAKKKKTIRYKPRKKSTLFFCVVAMKHHSAPITVTFHQICMRTTKEKKNSRSICKNEGNMNNDGKKKRRIPM